MALFPKVESPCPYKGRLADILENDVCRLCKRQVFDLTHMTDGERMAFMKGCSGDVCVTYRFPVRPAIAAAILAASAAALPAAACQDVTTVEVIAGGIHDPQNAQYVQVPDPKPVAELPVVYEPVTAKAPS